MRFALLGDHPDGLAFARALSSIPVAHDLVAYTSSHAFLGGSGFVGVRSHHSARPTRCARLRKTADLEEILADPAIEAIIVAGPLSDRPALLRRALRFERHVLCVHPLDRTPGQLTRPALIRQDVKCVLVPLLPEALHPAVRPACRVPRRGLGERYTCRAEIGSFQLLEIERGRNGRSPMPPRRGGVKPVLSRAGRFCGGSAARSWKCRPSARRKKRHLARRSCSPAVLSAAACFRQTLLPNQSVERLSLHRVRQDAGRAELLLPLGWNGPAQLGWRAPDGEYHEEYWERWDPWPTALERFEAAVASKPNGGRSYLSIGRTRCVRWSWTTRPGAACRSAGPVFWSILRLTRRSASKAR